MLLGASMAFSCDVLDKVPGSDVTEDVIFSTKKDFEAYLFGTYSFGLHSYYPYHNTNDYKNPNPLMCMTTPMTDESEMSTTWHISQTWNTGSVVKEDILRLADRRFDLRFEVIRRCNIIIERLPDTDFSETEIKNYMGEALFIRALNNFEMFKRYGGMPIIKKRFGISDEWALPRASAEEFIEFIVADCDEAAECLTGVHYTENQRGRITKAAALALKAKCLLFAASPLTNTGDPYISYDHNELVCYGNYDKERWKRAADAAQAALDECAVEGFMVLNEGDPENDYRKVFNVYDNCEIILAEKFLGKTGNWSWPWCCVIPAGLGMSSWGDNGVCVTHNHVAKYEKMDGTKMEWNPVGVVGHDIMEKYAQLDPRFRQTVAYNGSKWNDNYPDMQLCEGDTGESPQPKANVTGCLMHKIIPMRLGVGNDYQMVPNGILFRVAELYLDLAEALNEYSGPDQNVINALHVVRSRAGMPDVPSGLTQEQMRDRIKNERDIELCFEDHRLWDIMRWMDAEKDGVMRGNIYKEVLHRVSGAFLDQKCDYTIEVLEVRSFNRNLYHLPIYQSEVNKGYLIQNPGW